jgi:ethanolamine utilization protein EutQ (cupin superfamily)
MIDDHKIIFRGMEWQNPAAGVRFKAVISDDKKIRLVEFTEELVEENWCTKGHIGYVLEGRLHIDFNGTITIYEAGDGLLIPEGNAHKHKPFITKGERALLILIEKA